MDFEVAVVQDIILDETSKYFTSAGEWNSVGTVYFKKVKGRNYGSNGFAKPYFSNFVNYPLLNELVYIFQLPSPGIQTNNFKQVYYYITPLSIWNSNHHNGIPNIFENKDLPESQQRDYQQTELGAVRRVTDGTTDINLGNTFEEKSNIKPLRKFEGDVVIEGRLGNSIRLGSTVLRDGKGINTWSENGINGDPILLLRNGQGSKGSVGYLPTEENINTDLSSIYLTSTQKIPIQAASIETRKYLSYKENAPTRPDKYFGNQVIINAGRLVFNAAEDHLLLSSNNSINLSSNNSVNIDTESFVVQATNTYIGSKNATEPLLLGDTTTTLLNELIDILTNLVKDSITANAGGIPIVPFTSNSPALLLRLQKIQSEINSIKSNYNFTV